MAVPTRDEIVTYYGSVRQYWWWPFSSTVADLEMPRDASFKIVTDYQQAGFFGKLWHYSTYRLARARLLFCDASTGVIYDSALQQLLTNSWFDGAWLVSFFESLNPKGKEEAAGDPKPESTEGSSVMMLQLLGSSSVTYKLETVPGDGNCALHALEVSRADVIGTVRSAIEQENLKASAFLCAELAEELCRLNLEGHPQPIENPITEEMRSMDEAAFAEALAKRQVLFTQDVLTETEQQLVPFITSEAREILADIARIDYELDCFKLRVNRIHVGLMNIENMHDIPAFLEDKKAEESCIAGAREIVSKLLEAKSRWTTYLTIPKNLYHYLDIMSEDTVMLGRPLLLAYAWIKRITLTIFDKDREGHLILRPGSDVQRDGGMRKFLLFSNQHYDRLVPVVSEQRNLLGQ